MVKLLSNSVAISAISLREVFLAHCRQPLEIVRITTGATHAAWLAIDNIVRNIVLFTLPFWI